ncbi:c-type cytochrome [Gemmata sp.]|uniref:c-type cytochrome n=1 Tax=Gemmata sp. TaxID=1914242 RepID=UPI003F719647
MYTIDANRFMNSVLGLTLAAGALVFLLTLVLAMIGGPRLARVRSYLYMFSGLFGAFAVAVAVLGFRGQKSGDRPWHVFLDMKYQPKYTSQGQSRFFADGRSNRHPPSNTVPFDGTDYAADAGRHEAPNPDFLRADARYFTGVANPDQKDKDGVPAKPVWKDGVLAGEGYFVNHVPAEAVTAAGGWEPLLKRGQQQFGVHCAVCHGASGRGGGGEVAYGIVGAKGLSVAPSNLTGPDVQAQTDGQLFNSITNGVRNMPAYAHQVKVQDRWAIVAHVRVLQYAAGR